MARDMIVNKQSRIRFKQKLYDDFPQLMFDLMVFYVRFDIFPTLTESTGNIAQCSATPAAAPAKATYLKGVEAGKLS